MSSEADRSSKNVGGYLTLRRACALPETSTVGVGVVAAVGVGVIAAFGDPSPCKLQLSLAPSRHLIRHDLLLCARGLDLSRERMHQVAPLCLVREREVVVQMSH